MAEPLLVIKKMIKFWNGTIYMEMNIYNSPCNKREQIELNVTEIYRLQNRFSEWKKLPVFLWNCITQKKLGNNSHRYSI